MVYSWQLGGVSAAKSHWLPPRPRFVIYLCVGLEVRNSPTNLRPFDMGLEEASRRFRTSCQKSVSYVDWVCSVSQVDFYDVRPGRTSTPQSSQAPG